MFKSVSLFWHIPRSGTEEEYTELAQLLEDISTYTHDVQVMKTKEKQQRKMKEQGDKMKTECMRKAAMEGMASRFLCIAYILIVVK